MRFYRMNTAMLTGDDLKAISHLKAIGGLEEVSHTRCGRCGGKMLLDSDGQSCVMCGYREYSRSHLKVIGYQTEIKHARCARCGGKMLVDYDDLSCINCGYHEYARGV